MNHILKTAAVALLVSTGITGITTAALASPQAHTEIAKAKKLMNRAKYIMEVRDYSAENPRRLLKKAYRILRDNMKGPSLHIAVAYFMLAEADVFKARFRSADANIERAVAEAEAAMDKDDANLARAYIRAARLYVMHVDPDQAGQYFQKAEALLSNSNDAILSAALLSVRGEFETSRRRFRNAMQKYEAALEIYQELGGHHAEMKDLRGRLVLLSSLIGDSETADDAMKDMVAASDQTSIQAPEPVLPLVLASRVGGEGKKVRFKVDVSSDGHITKLNLDEHNVTGEDYRYARTVLDNMRFVPALYDGRQIIMADHYVDVKFQKRLMIYEQPGLRKAGGPNFGTSLSPNGVYRVNTD